MHIVTDSAMDVTPEQIAGFKVHFLPLKVTLEDKTYSSGVDLQPKDFYRMLGETESFPITSQPSSGEFAELYRSLAKTDPDILSIHISSGLSGTLNAAKAGAAMVPEAKVTFYDTHTLSCPEGWHVLAAASAAQAGAKVKDILAMMENISKNTMGLFTLASLKYLVHGGRINHLKGLLASLLNIKPVIGPDKIEGKYVTFGQEITFKRAVSKIGDVLLQYYPEGSEMRIQPLHGDNLAGVELLRERLNQIFQVTWEPLAVVTPALGAHTGPSLVGLSAAPLSVFKV
jgi:DegV family protein with EDD domain